MFLISEGKRELLNTFHIVLSFFQISLNIEVAIAKPLAKSY